MSVNTTIRVLFVTALLQTSGDTLAQDLLGPTRSPIQDSTIELPVERSDVVAVGEREFMPISNACVCTNLNGVTLICPESDQEVDPESCQTHDRACQDTAQKGGIREHATFFSTTKY